MKIGIINESRVPPDKRAPFTPEQCRVMLDKFPELQIIVQSSTIRAFTNAEYEKLGITVQDDVTDCDILFGIKEIAIEKLIPNKTYLIFSHTIKKQNYNKCLLKAILEKKIRLIDYEVLVDINGNRLVGFGHVAGLVGAYNAFRQFSLRYKLPLLQAAHNLSDLDALKKEVKKRSFPALKIAFTGAGRVAKGVKELLDSMGVKELDVDSYLDKDLFSEPVYVQLQPNDYNVHKKGHAFELHHFYKHPDGYKGNFKRFARTTDILISSAFWDSKAPVLFTRSDMCNSRFRIKVIADISCDIDGAIPSTLRASTSNEPFYDYNPTTGKEELPFSNRHNVTVMAVDNLPNELPMDASREFGESLIKKVLPLFINGDMHKILERATIARDGTLTETFSYLYDWLHQ